MDHPVIVYDGECNVCSGLVRFILKRDVNKIFQFTPAQSLSGSRLIDGSGLSEDPRNTIVLIDGESYYRRSTAALQIARRLPLPWKLLFAFKLIPKPVRDWIYRLVAVRRYRLFGKRDTCFLPVSKFGDRFLAESDERNPGSE